GQQLATAGADRTVRLWEVATGKEVTTMPGQAGELRVVAFSPDGKRLAWSGSEGVRLQGTSVEMSELDRLRREAQEAREREAAQRRRADEAERQARVEREQALQDAQRALYASRIALALREWEANQAEEAGRHLDACPEPLRSWEWHYLKRKEGPDSVRLAGA